MIGSGSEQMNNSRVAFLTELAEKIKAGAVKSLNQKNYDDLVSQGLVTQEYLDKLKQNNKLLIMAAQEVAGDRGDGRLETEGANFGGRD